MKKTILNITTTVAFLGSISTAPGCWVAVGDGDTDVSGNGNGNGSNDNGDGGEKDIECAIPCWNDPAAQFPSAQPLEFFFDPSDAPLSCESNNGGSIIDLSGIVGTDLFTTTCINSHADAEIIYNCIENQGCSAADQHEYENFIDEMAELAYDDCVETLEQLPPEGLNCNVFSAWDVCDAYLQNPMRYEMYNYNRVPQQTVDGSKIVESAEACDYGPLGQGMSGTESGGAADETGNGGTDTTGAEVKPFEVFGDLSSLVREVPYKTSGTELYMYDPVLRNNIESNYMQFAEDGAVFRISSGGAEITGLDKDEASTYLAKAFGLANGHNVLAVDGIEIKDEESFIAAFAAVSEASRFSMKVETCKATCATRTVLIQPNQRR